MTPTGITLGIGVRTVADNPWFKRLQTSLEEHPCGISGVEAIVEQGSALNRIEKKIRLFRRCKTRYLILLEDDVEILHPNWLIPLFNALLSLPNTAIAGPLEVGYDPTKEQALTLVTPTVTEVANLGGLCQLIDLESGVQSNVLIQTFDDLYLSLLARSRGYRLVKTDGVVVRHTKQPWAKDGVPPWEQTDRSRFGEGHAYYQQEQHQKVRIAEARWLIDHFGDLARQMLPRDTMAVLEPGRNPTEADELYACCMACRKFMGPEDDLVMVRMYYPVCGPCYANGAYRQLPVLTE